MGRGLGTWQRRVMDALDDSLNADLTEPGMAFYLGTEECWHKVHGIEVMLADGVYDLDVVRGRLMRGTDISDWHRHTMQEAISRAVRTLCSRGELIPLSLVPVTRYRGTGLYGKVPSWAILELADGTYLDYGKRQVRFVRRGRSWQD